MPVANIWSYARCDDGSRVEQAIWHGDVSPSLAAHFHDEIQITVVMAGVQRFATPIGLIEAHVGETAVIGPTVPHEPLGLDALGTVSLNLYVRPMADTLVARGLCVLATPHWLQRRLDGPRQARRLGDRPDFVDRCSGSQS
jgi:hypothetical protein